MFQHDTLAPLGSVKARGQPFLLMVVQDFRTGSVGVSISTKSLLLLPRTHMRSYENNYIRKQMRNSCLIKLSSITRDTFKHKHVILFETGRISLDYITDKLPLRKTFFYFPQFCSFMCFLLFFISEDVLFSIYLNIAFLPFSPTNQRSNFLT